MKIEVQTISPSPRHPVSPSPRLPLPPASPAPPAPLPPQFPNSEFRASNSSPLPPEIDDPTYLTHRCWMMVALELAAAAGEAGEVPVGAVVVDKTGNSIATGENRRERDRNPIAHAEILAIQQASQVLQTWRLSECTLYVTLEPCPMCAGAIVQSRLGLLVYGAHEPKTGAIRTVMNLPDGPCSYHRLNVLGGILESTCQEQLRTWFAQRRSL